MQEMTDIERLLSLKSFNGGDWWACPDGSFAKGSPFTTPECAVMLAELANSLATPEREAIAETLFARQREDGRFKASPSGAIYPCQTAGAARAICALGYAEDPRLERTYHALLDARHEDGGWRCNAAKFGPGPENAFSNPGTTLTALEVFRQSPFSRDPSLDAAVEFLLAHWRTRAPLGPCRHGIGSRFLKLEYPMLRYNIFHYVYTLSFYLKARGDGRFLDAFEALRAKVKGNEVVGEASNRKLSGLHFCEAGALSPQATRRYREILMNLSML